MRNQSGKTALTDSQNSSTSYVTLTYKVQLFSIIKLFRYSIKTSFYLNSSQNHVFFSALKYFHSPTEPPKILTEADIIRKPPADVEAVSRDR